MLFVISETILFTSARTLSDTESGLPVYAAETTAPQKTDRKSFIPKSSSRKKIFFSYTVKNFPQII